MIDYRGFIRELRYVELEIPYLVLNNHISPKLYEYISALSKVEFVDGAYHTYCGEIKFWINLFINFWMETINDAIREADRLINTMTKDDLMQLMDKSITVFQKRQEQFEKGFLPVETPEEQEHFTIIQNKFEKFMESLYALQARLDKFDKQEDVTEFTKEAMGVAVQRKVDLFSFAHKHISLTLATCHDRVRISLEECLGRVRNNLREMEVDRENILSELMEELYDKNKDRMILARKDRKNSADEAEIAFSISKLQDKIKHYYATTPIPRLEEEVHFWERRLKEFNKIQTTLIKLIKAKEEVLEHEEDYKTMKCAETVPTSKCWLKVDEAIRKRKQFIDKKYLKAAKAMLTFFAIRGQNRILYKDDVGEYFLDDFGHQIYAFHHARTLCHVTCDGSFVEVKESSKYYFDRNGRYIIDENGEKLYQAAACTSTYKLGNDDLFTKTTRDCGHSDTINKECMMQLKDPNDREILPETKITDIKGTLQPEVVKYLWDCFGHILPSALCDVGQSRHNNPIHHLGHSVLSHQYSRTTDETKALEKEAQVFRSNVYKKRQEVAIEKSKIWKAKQVKRRKPEESDDTMQRNVYDNYVKQQEFICKINECNNN